MRAVAEEVAAGVAVAEGAAEEVEVEKVEKVGRRCRHHHRHRRHTPSTARNSQQPRPETLHVTSSLWASCPDYLE